MEPSPAGLLIDHEIGGNPAFKIYDVDPDTFEIMDSRVYFSMSFFPPLRAGSPANSVHLANITAPNFQSSTPQWELLYSARATYGPLVTPALAASAPLDPEFWHNLTEVFAADASAFALFNTFLSRGGDVGACDADCQAAAVCDLRAMRAENNCVSALSLAAEVQK